MTIYMNLWAPIMNEIVRIAMFSLKLNNKINFCLQI